MKKTKKLIIISSLILMLVIAVCLLLILKNKKNNNKNTITSLSDAEVIKHAKDLIEEDFEIKNMIYGNIKVDEAQIIIDNKAYNHYQYKNIKSLDNLYQMINDNYSDSSKTILLKAIGKYNKIIQVDKNLYIQKNPLCNLKDFDDNITIIKRYNNYALFNYMDSELKIAIDNNMLKLTTTPYECTIPETTTKAES